MPWFRAPGAPRRREYWYAVAESPPIALPDQQRRLTERGLGVAGADGTGGLARLREHPVAGREAAWRSAAWAYSSPLKGGYSSVSRETYAL